MTVLVLITFAMAVVYAVNTGIMFQDSLQSFTDIDTLQSAQFDFMIALSSMYYLLIVYYVF
jgi:hypothetical protein